jgi:hypothetical protein
MTRLLLLIVALLLLAGAFFVAWPGWAAYETYKAILANDVPALERRIDFPRVRASLRPAVAEKMLQLHVPAQTGPTSPVLAERLKREAVGRLVGNVLENLVTAENLVLVVSEAGPLKDGVERMLRDEMGRGGAPRRVGPVTTLSPGQAAAKQAAGIPPPPKRGPVVRTISSEEPQPGSGAEAAAASEPGYGFRNIKSFSVLGPFRYEIGLAKSRAAKEPEVLAELGFTLFGWKITAVRPNS